MSSLARFSINQMTVKQLSMPELVESCLELGIQGVGLWREPVQSYGLDATAKLVRDAGLAVTTLCRGGFFTAIDPQERARALDDNRAAVDEAATLGTDTLVLVSGGLPGRLEGPARGAGADRRRAGGAGPVRRRAGRAAGHRAPPPHVRRGPLCGVHPCPGPGPRGTLPGGPGGRHRRHVPHLVGRHGSRPDRPRGRRMAVSTPSSSPTGRLRCPRASSTAAVRSATVRSTCGSGGGTSRRRDTPGRSRSSCSTTGCGRATGGRCWRRRRRGSWSTPGSPVGARCHFLVTSCVPPAW